MDLKGITRPIGVGALSVATLYHGVEPKQPETNNAEVQFCVSVHPEYLGVHSHGEPGIPKSWEVSQAVTMQIADVYIGKRALERIRVEGVRRKLVGIEVPGDPLPYEIAEYWPAHAEGRPVGHVTDLIWSPRLRKNIGYVWIPVELAAPGTELRVEMPEGSTAARTASIPFLDPRKRIPAA